MSSLFGLLVSYAGSAAAAGVTLAEPALCTTAEELAFRVSRALGQPVASVAGPEFAVRIRSARAGFAAQLETGATASGPARERSFSAANCEELTDSVALAIALALGSSAPEPPAPQEPATEAAPPPPPAPDEGPSEAPASDASDASGPHVGVLGWMVADTGSLPGVGLGVSAGAGLAWSMFELRAVGLFLPAREGHPDGADENSPGAELSLLAGSVLACAPLSDPARRLQVLACAGWELGQLSGEGTQVATPHESSTLWSAARLDLGAGWLIPGSPLALELLVSVLAPLTRDEFILKDIGAVHQPASVVARAGLGLGWSWQ
ncbi:MAG TPA: hypothetical protein VJU61_06450 [Polyangiaceae bacterium]|nr:hypothetical protein [Polyangiaceae bacterium]